MSSYKQLREAYTAAGQEHVFTFWPELTSQEQGSLIRQLASIDPARVNEVYKLAMSQDGLPVDKEDNDRIAPPPVELVDTPSGNPEAESKWRETGYSAMESGKVGIILLAGGQGTRLGSSDPKGCYDIGLPSGKSLFQLQAERIRRLQELKKTKLPWYIMTSGPTRKATEAFFEKHAYFGLDKENVIFFNQGVLPCLTNEGKIFLDTKSSVAVAPDGNGGIYEALRSTSATGRSFSVLSDMQKRGIQYLYTYCVDNCLARVGDPVFLGYCIGKNAQCGTKVVKKSDPAESVGVVALKGGKWNVIEYSEISKELSEAKDPNSKEGDLLFRAANIANHFYDLSFLNKIDSFSSSMAYHIARKKIPHTDLQSGELLKPSKPNGMKLELFIFDVLPYLQPLEQHALLVVERKNEFSPLKSAPGTGVDDPQTSRRDLLQIQKGWLKEAGANFEDEEGTEVELSPLVSYAGEGLKEVVDGKKIRKGTHSVQSMVDLEKLFV